MNIKHKKEEGSALAIFAAVVTTLLIGALAWIFWQNFIYKQPAKEADKVATVDKKASTEEQKKTQYLDVKEFGIKIPLTDDIVDLAVDPVPDADYVYLVSSSKLGKAMHDIDSTCKTESRRLIGGAFLTNTVREYNHEYARVTVNGITYYLYQKGGQGPFCESEDIAIGEQLGKINNDYLNAVESALKKAESS